MKAIGISAVVVTVIGVAALFLFGGSSDSISQSSSFSDTEVGFDTEPELASPNEYRIGRGKGYALNELREWQRPDGPLRVGLQVGHLDNQDMPEELEGLENNGSGAVSGPYNERDTVEVITELVAEDLRANNILVDVLPATVPPGYVADVFVSIHADGNNNTSVRGYKIAGPRRDYSGRSEALVAALYSSYGEATNLPIDPSISRRMTAYYAFNWPRYEHAIHPFTPAVIVETGFLTNAADRSIIVSEPERAAAGIAEGIKNYLSAIPDPVLQPQTLVAPTFPLTGTFVCATVRAERRDRDDGECTPALATDTSEYVIVGIASTSLPTIGSQLTITGEYRPVQLLDNYFWFQYEVAGIIEVPSR